MMRVSRFEPWLTRGVGVRRLMTIGPCRLTAARDCLGLRRRLKRDGR